MDLFFEKYGNERLQSWKIEKFLSKCEEYKLITICILLTKKITPQDVTRNFLTMLMNPLYQQLLNRVANVLLDWRHLLFPETS